jgi:hypothetical protein
MQRWIFAAAIFLTGAFQAHATTYDYTGQPFTSFEGLCGASICTSIAGSVTFNFDTSHFSGTLSLAAGDYASLNPGVPQRLSGGGFFSTDLYYPTSTIWFNPPQNTYGFAESLSGTFTLVNGAITSWSFGGGTRQVGCGGGPGCAVGSSSAFTSTTFDSSSIFGYPVYGGTCYLYCTNSASNLGGGVWVEEQIAAVPEPSTWAMMLIGFLGIGFVRYRKSRSINTMPLRRARPRQMLSSWK